MNIKFDIPIRIWLKILDIMTQGKTQMLPQEADGWSLTMFINPKVVGKRMVIDRQNQIRVQEVQSGRQA